MIQFNLLPAIKMQYIKARRQEHLVILISTVVIIASLSVLTLLIVTSDVVQKHEISDATNAVQQETSQVKNTPNLDEMLTVQSQLKTLPSLHDNKPAVSRLFTYLTQLTPTKATISTLDIDYTANDITITGSADSLATVNQFTDTLKFTGYTLKGEPGTHPAFSEVVLASFSDSSQSGAAYTLTANFDPALFEQLDNVSLTVPGIINTRSEVAQPGVLFVQSSNDTSS
jgi:Tfp pilus assembly protein PilN